MTWLIRASSTGRVFLLACLLTGAVVAQSGERETGTLDVPPLILPGGSFPSHVDYDGSRYPEYEENDSGDYYYNYFYHQNESVDLSGGFMPPLFEEAADEESEISEEEYRHLYPESPSVCMPPVYNDGVEVDYTTGISDHRQRRVLSMGELQSEPAKEAVMHAVKFFNQKKNETANLEMTEIKSGCRQNYAGGELLFLVFDAKETLICDITAVNATCTENTMRTVECRSRVHFSTSTAWYPFYTSCHLPAFYEIDRQGVNIKYL